jgi:adenine-specific DNA-methyltransferase
MARKSKLSPDAASYVHDETRKNIPDAGVMDVAAKGEPKDKKTEYCWDPRESPQLVWAGKAGLKKVEVDEQTSLEVPLVNLHIHERVSTEAIVRAVKRDDVQRSLFAEPDLEGAKALQFYQHEVDWANRMILGDSLLVMNSLIEREGMRGQVQCIYMDPPYGIKYASNFQPRIDQRDVKDGKDEDLTREVMQVQAFRDTWELGVHSYLTYLRDRLLLARELLKDTGSIFVQIGDENVHRVRCLMDEVFGEENFVSHIFFATTSGFQGKLLDRSGDLIVWYAKDIENAPKKYRQITQSKGVGPAEGYDCLIFPDGSMRAMTAEEIRGEQTYPGDSEPYNPDNIKSQGGANEEQTFEHQGKRYLPGINNHWKANFPVGMRRLALASRIHVSANSIRYVRRASDFAQRDVNNVWQDTNTGQFSGEKLFSVWTPERVIERCILMTTDPGDLVLDPTCGSGTTSYVAEQWGRRWITCDTSRVALAIARHRLMTAAFDWFKLRHPSAGVAGGFRYKTVPHITLKGIAQNQEIDAIAAEYQPQMDAALASLNAFLRETSERERARNDQLPPFTELREWEVPRMLGEYSERFLARAELHNEKFSRGEVNWYYDDFEELRKHKQLLVAFWDLKREMQAKIDASIQRNAPQEELVDQPEKEPGIVRVSGPFTMEAVPDVGGEVSAGVEEKIFENDLQMQIFEPAQSALTAVEAKNVSAYLSDMIEKLKKVGVETRTKQRLTFASLRPLDHAVLHAEGEIANGQTKRVAVMFGPANGSISETHVREAIRSSRKYDVLLLCGYDFTAAAQEMARANSDGEFQVLLAYVAPDTVMGDLLKDTKASQLFTMVGEPDVVVYRHGDPDLERLAADAERRGVGDVRERLEALEPGQMFVELRGVDLYDPVTGEVRSDAGENVHAVFIDHDYDGRSFCICQALFPNKKDSWTKIARNLKGSIDEEAFAAFRTLVSLPFKPGTSFLPEQGEGRVQVKVIDARGNAVVKTVRSVLC